jgi:hypothetical protein
MVDIARTGIAVKEILDDVNASMKETRESVIVGNNNGPADQNSLGVEEFVDPRDEVLGSWQWAQIYYDAFMTLFLPTFDVLTDWASLISLALLPGGLFASDCDLVRGVGGSMAAANVILLVATINGTLFWCCGAFLFWRRWSKVGSFRDKVRVAMEGLADDVSTRHLCQKGVKSPFRAGHALQVCTLLLEDFPSLFATLLLLLTLGGTTATLVSFFVSVLSFSKLFFQYASLLVVVCCRKRPRRTVVIARFVCCTCFCAWVAAAFVAAPFVKILAPFKVPHVMPVRSWHLRVPALGIDRQFVPADNVDLRTLYGTGFLLAGGIDGTTLVRIAERTTRDSLPTQVADSAVEQYGTLLSLPFDEALVIDLAECIGQLLNNEAGVAVHGAATAFTCFVHIWRRECHSMQTYLPVFAGGVFRHSEQSCLQPDEARWEENCSLATAVLTPPIDFYTVDPIEMSPKINIAFNLTRNELVAVGADHYFGCAEECFNRSPFCDGFGERDRTDLLPYMELEIVYGESQKLCIE